MEDAQQGATGTDEIEIDPAVKAHVEQVRERRERPGISRPDREGDEVIKAAANGAKLSDGEKIDALEWMLAEDDGTEPEDFAETLVIDVGSKRKPQPMDWTIKPVDGDRIRQIRKESQTGTRAQRRAGTTELNEGEFAARMVVAGTLYPDLRAVAGQKGIDPAEVVRLKFVRKPGLVQQLSGEILDLSGYDDEDIREVDAAGN